MELNYWVGLVLGSKERERLTDCEFTVSFKNSHTPVSKQQYTKWLHQVRASVPM